MSPIQAWKSLDDLHRVPPAGRLRRGVFQHLALQHLDLPLRRLQLCSAERASSKPRLWTASASSKESSPPSIRATIFSSSASAPSKEGSPEGLLIF
jgi:hypothetical protein